MGRAGSAVLAVLFLAPLVAMAQNPAPSAAPPPATTFGMDLALDTDAAGIAREGVKWARITADWSLIEPTRGKFEWTALDKLVESATASGLRLTAAVANTPRWAALDPDTQETVWRHQPPRDLADWQHFVAEAAARYRGKVAAWQIIPALDFAVFRGTVPDYIGMLRTARQAIRLADPHALVVAVCPRGLDLAYMKGMLLRPLDEFDALLLFTGGRSPEDVIEALGAIRGRLTIDPRRQLWLADGNAGGPQLTPDDAVGDHMVRMAAVAVAGGVTRQFWSGRETAPKWAPVRQTLMKRLDGARAVGWLPRAPNLYAFIMMKDESPVAALWSSGEPRVVPLPAANTLTIVTPQGESAPAASGTEGQAAAAAGRSPVLVSGVAASVVEEARQAALGGPFRPMRDPAHDFTNADSVSVTLGATNTERGLYNQRFRSIPSGAVVPVTLDGAEAVQTDPAKEVMYVYLDVDHSYAYFLDGQQDIIITVQVHRAKAVEQAGFNVLYDSATGYRFTSWQWVEPGNGWVTYTIRLTDAGFSSTWGWDFAINAAGTRKEPLIVRSVTLRKVRPGGRIPGGSQSSGASRLHSARWPSE